jgi:hypothetical protein
MASSTNGHDEDPRISCLILGHNIYMWHTPMRILSIKDPLFVHAEYPIPPDLDDASKRKLDRVYYPRTRSELIESYDYIVVHGGRIQHFLSRQIFDLDYAFREANMTAFNALDLAWEYAWQPTILHEVVPVSEHYSASPYSTSTYSVRFHRDRDPVFLPFLELGAEKVEGVWFCEMRAKQGATVWADLVQSIAPVNRELPWMVSWKPGGGSPGMQWVVSHSFDGWWEEENNPYALDIATNMVFYSLEMPLVSDLHARREARRLFYNIQAQKSLILSMMEWASNFGANVIPLWEKLTELELEIEGATSHYFDQEYAPTISFLDSLSPTIMEITGYALDIKDQALFWVYLSEWLATSSVAIISGTVLWTLMVRRKAYRSVEASRLRPIDLDH